jgi:hypothetical protein
MIYGWTLNHRYSNFLLFYFFLFTNLITILSFLSFIIIIIVIYVYFCDYYVIKHSIFNPKFIAIIIIIYVYLCDYYVMKHSIFNPKFIALTFYLTKLYFCLSNFYKLYNFYLLTFIIILLALNFTHLICKILALTDFNKVNKCGQWFTVHMYKTWRRCIESYSTRELTWSKSVGSHYFAKLGGQ